MVDKDKLDDQEKVLGTDVSKMVDMISNLPDDMASLLEGPGPKVPQIDGIRNIVISGMGGSAISGDIIRSWLGDRFDIPIYVSRGYTVPGFIGKDTLFISMSFSGNTEETLSSFKDALVKGCKILTFSTGGILEEISSEAGIVHNRIIAPEGMVPRAALGLMLVPLARSLEAAKMVNVSQDLREAVDVLKNMRTKISHGTCFEKNEAKILASKLYGKVPIVIGAGPMEVPALRWKCQFNENSKVLAWVDTLPEMDHNSIVGWAHDKIASGFAPVILRDKSSERSDARIRNRIQATKEAVWSRPGWLQEVWSRGNGTISRIMSTIYMGDHVSVYLALLRDVDPTPVEVIEGLKRALKDMS